MHDAISGEQLGVPSVGIMTEKFVSAAELMARVLGAADHPFVVIPHPISSATDADLRQSAHQATTECVALLTTRPAT